MTLSSAPSSEREPETKNPETRALVEALERLGQQETEAVSLATLNRLEALGLVETEIDGNTHLAPTLVGLETEALSARVEAVLSEAQTNQAIESGALSKLPIRVTHDSPFGRFIIKGGSDNQIHQRERALKPFLALVDNVVRALNSKKNNHVMVSASDLDENQDWRFRLVQQIITDSEAYLGEDLTAELAFVDSSSVFDVDLSSVEGSAFKASNVLFDLFVYAFTGRINPSLKHQPGMIRRAIRRARSHPPSKTILQQISVPEHPFNAFKTAVEAAQASGKKPVLSVPYEFVDYSVLLEGPEGIHQSLFLDALNTSFSAAASVSREDREFADYLRTLPAFITLPEFSHDEDDRLRNFTLGHAAFNPALLEAADLEEVERQSIKAEEVRYHLKAMLGETIEAADDLDEMADALGLEVEEVDAGTVINYFFRNASDLNLMFLKQALEALNSLRIRRLPLETRNYIIRKLNGAEALITRFEQFGRSVPANPYLDFPYNGPFRLVSAADTYLNLEGETIGVEAETDEVLAVLSTGQSVAINDTTQFDAKKLPFKGGEHFTLHDRLTANLVRRLAEGQVPTALKGVILVEFKRIAEFVKLFYQAQGFNIDDRTNFDIDKPLQELKDYNDRPVVILKADEVENAERFNSMVKMMESKGIQVLVLSKSPIPGIPNIHIANITESNLTQRVFGSRQEIETHIGAKVSDETLQHVIAEVNTLREIQQDPLSMVMQVLQSAASAARIRGDKNINRQDMASALAFSFNKADATQARQIEQIFAEAPMVVSRYVAGLEEPISEVLTLVKNHLLGAGEADKPLALMLPGPTGVGKTLFIKTIAKHLGLPILEIDGSRYTKENALSRLIGSEREYKGDNEGKLTGFLKAHPKGIVFFDEFDKFHPSIRQHLMNFFDTGKMENGKSEEIHRPAMCILCATNAGAGKLRPGQSKGELQDIVAQSLVNEFGVVQQEQTKRFTIVPFVGVEYSAMMDSIEKETAKLNHRTAYQIFGINVVGVTPAAQAALFETIKGSCTFLNTERKPPYNDETAIYFNLREIPRGINNAISPQVSDIIAQKAGLNDVSIDEIEQETPNMELTERFAQQEFSREHYQLGVSEGKLTLLPLH